MPLVSFPYDVFGELKARSKKDGRPMSHILVSAYKAYEGARRLAEQHEAEVSKTLKELERASRLERIAGTALPPAAKQAPTDGPIYPQLHPELLAQRPEEDEEFDPDA